MNHSTPGLPVHHQLPEFTQTHVHWVSDAIQPSHSLSSPSPLAPNPSQHQSPFQWVNSLHEWPKYWSFSFSIIPSKGIPGLISFRMDWLDLLAVQGTLKSLVVQYNFSGILFYMDTQTVPTLLIWVIILSSLNLQGHLFHKLHVHTYIGLLPDFDLLHWFIYYVSILYCWINIIL